MTKPAVAFRGFANAPKNVCEFPIDITVRQTVKVSKIVTCTLIIHVSLISSTVIRFVHKYLKIIDTALRFILRMSCK